MQRRAALIGYAWVVVGDAELAEDVFQEVSVVAIRKGDEIEDADHLVGWLHKAVRLEGLKARRKRAAGHTLLSPEVIELIEHARPDASFDEESANMSALRECIKSIQGAPRAMIEMRYGQNLKPAQIAKQTNKKIQTVYKTITRAHSLLRDCVKDRLATEGGQR